MHTRHTIHFTDSRSMEAVADESIDLIVTSPPYPMIEMWDAFFSEQDPKIRKAFRERNPWEAFEKMHLLLDGVWAEGFRVLKRGGIACINIGDAVRTWGENFALYPNHARILSSLRKIGFIPLPCILWRKQINAPNKFMGSGMLPPGAYVTLEHEHILIARKGGIRRFNTASEKERRRESAFFWEERNAWFSDVWTDLKGTVQNLVDPKIRNRSAAFPFELPFRLIAMFSVKGDTVLDPFLGTGPTLLAAMAQARNGIGYESDRNFEDGITLKMGSITALSNRRILERLEHHTRFVESRAGEGKPLKHRNRHYGFPVMTLQETGLIFNEMASCEKADPHAFVATYAKTTESPNTVITGGDLEMKETGNPAEDTGRYRMKTPRQGSLF